jgi:acetyl/propionyl-CoA carboxylase alpha subunit
MKKINILMLFIGVLFAYEAQVKPFEKYNITSSVAGEVIASKKDKEADVYTGVIVKIDDKQDLIDLKNVKSQIDLTRQEIENQKEVVKRKYQIYKKYQNLKTKSQEVKNLKFYDYIAAKNQLIALNSKLDDLISKRDKLKDIIDKKNIKVNGYIEAVLVKKGDYVAPGKVVAVVDDISKEKLTIYVPIEKIDQIKNKTVYINGKKSNFKIYKIWKTPDSQYITSYKVELVGNGLKIGDIVKIVLK